MSKQDLTKQFKHACTVSFEVTSDEPYVPHDIEVFQGLFKKAAQLVSGLTENVSPYDTGVEIVSTCDMEGK